MTTVEHEYAATEQHMALLAAKRDKLNDLITQAEEQYSLSVYREWQAGYLGWDDLREAYFKVKANGVGSYSKRWTEAGLPTINKIQTMLRYSPDLEAGYWHGRYPWPASYLGVPPRGTNVVYILFADDLEAIYVGSTQFFTSRMRQHRKAGKRWSSWIAHPCDDREHAYQIEEKFLAQYMPALNIKRGR